MSEENTEVSEQAQALEKLRKEDPVYHDLVVSFLQYQEATRFQEQALGTIVDLIANNFARKRRSKKND